MKRIAIDAFGGDNAPGEIISGCALALCEHDDVYLILTGDESAIDGELTRNGVDRRRVEIRHAPELIDPNEAPVDAVRRKKNSSLVAALNAVANQEADAFISAGSTGAVLAGATFIVKRIEGVKRPALAPVLPSAKGPAVLIDCGANVDCKPEFLLQFAQMGSAYSEKVLGVTCPRIGLINNGAEEHKGNALTKEAFQLLQNSGLNFSGNVEGRDILSGDYDVLVADGFVGNVVLKYTEGMASTLFGMLKEEFMGSARSKLGALLLKPSLKRFKKRMDYTEYGGALLLGINGGIIKAHGSSNAVAIKNTIIQARSFIESDIINVIKRSLKDQ